MGLKLIPNTSRRRRVQLVLFGLLILTLVCILVNWQWTFVPKTFSALEHYDFNNQNNSTGSESFPIPSVVLKLNVDGTGNQLFKYAAAYSLARRLNLTFFIIPQESTRDFNPRSRDLALDHFNLSLGPTVRYLSSEQTFPENITYKLTNADVYKKQICRDKILLIDDYFESELFFEDYKEDLVQQFQMVNINRHKIGSTMERIENSESVAVHIRRGDFITKDRLLPLSYQIRAMELITHLKRKDQLKFFIFSDDIKFTKASFNQISFIKDVIGLDNMIYVSNPSITSLQEFYLMQHCKHIITPNSSFSWWAAYLNQNKDKIVIVPFPRQKRSFYYREYGHDLQSDKNKIIRLIDWNYAYPKGWIGINPFESFEDGLGSIACENSACGYNCLGFVHQLFLIGAVLGAALPLFA